MPKRDGTGPFGGGPKTGRQVGPCGERGNIYGAWPRIGVFVLVVGSIMALFYLLQWCG